MTDIRTMPPDGAPLPEVRDLRAALLAGVDDFLRAPRFGLVFSAVYVVGGFLMIRLGAGLVAWTLATSPGSTLLAMVPWFLGLVVVLPVLGHATWHLYRRVLG